MSAVRVRVRLGTDPAGGLLAIVGWSAVAHVAVFFAIVFGPKLIPRRPPPPLVLTGQIVSLPGAAAIPSGPPAPARAAAPPTAAPAKPKEPAPPPKPRARRSEEVPPEPGRQKAPKTPGPKTSAPAAPEEKPAEPASKLPEGPIPEGVGLSAPGAGGDPSGIPSINSGAFPFDWYRTTIVNLIRSRWRRPVTPGLTQPLRCAVSFLVSRNGVVSDVTLAASSGFAALDESAQRAVAESSPLPNLPYQYTSESVRAELVFELTPD